MLTPSVRCERVALNGCYSMISDQERLDKCEHTSPMKTGREGYIGGKEGGRNGPFRPDELVACCRPGDASCHRFEQFRKQMRINRCYFELFELLAFFAAGCFFEECALGHFQRCTFGTTGRNDFRLTGIFFAFPYNLHRLATHHRALAHRQHKPGAAQQDQEGHQDGDRSMQFVFHINASNWCLGHWYGPKNRFRAKSTNYQTISSATYPAFLMSSWISSGEWLVSTFSTRSALSRSTAQFSTFSSPFRNGVTVATQPPHLILVLNCKVSMVTKIRILVRYAMC